jgi:DNA polymerase Ligase (LigD)
LYLEPFVILSGSSFLPQTRRIPGGEMPRFVILEHDHPSRHWDFMLEKGDVLRTWKLAGCPQPGHTVPAEPSFDHRLVYLDYEGPVSGGRGSVSRWDAGAFTWLTDTPDAVTVSLAGNRCRGVATLRLTDRAKCVFSLTEEEGPASGGRSPPVEAK